MKTLILLVDGHDLLKPSELDTNRKQHIAVCADGSSQQRALFGRVDTSYRKRDHVMQVTGAYVLYGPARNGRKGRECLPCLNRMS